MLMVLARQRTDSIGNRFLLCLVERRRSRRQGGELATRRLKSHHLTLALVAITSREGGKKSLGGEEGRRMQYHHHMSLLGFPSSVIAVHFYFRLRRRRRRRHRRLFPSLSPQLNGRSRGESPMEKSNNEGPTMRPKKKMMIENTYFEVEKKKTTPICLCGHCCSKRKLQNF